MTTTHEFPLQFAVKLVNTLSAKGGADEAVLAGMGREAVGHAQNWSRETQLRVGYMLTHADTRQFVSEIASPS